MRPAFELDPPCPPRDTPRSRSAGAARPDRGCPPWCGDGHAAPAEHVSPPRVVTPSRDAAHVSVCARTLDPTHDEVFVSLVVNLIELPDKDSVELLPTEARALASALLEAAELAELRGR